MRKFFVLLLLPLQIFAQPFSKTEINKWQTQASHVTIIRDNWGIPHVYGHTDADAVFGLLYAQCEDDFSRVELNYIEKLGRLSEVFGAKDLNDDLLMRLIIDSADAEKDYASAAPWFKKLLDAFADGVNYYLYKHATVKPLLLQRFKPWYALLWTDGSIGAINTAGITADEVGDFYLGNNATTFYEKPFYEKPQTGSNGFAIAPSRSVSGNAMLYINPHVTFYFRPEVQMASDEGLNAYGAVTWGQFFVYQGFNEHCGWMHTSGYSDNADLYIEKISGTKNNFFYSYDNILKPVIQKQVVLKYKEDDMLQTKTVTTYSTIHGPVMATRNKQWISLQANNRSMDGLIECWQRTKATSFAAFTKNLQLRANTSNNTVYADAAGNIAYWHGNFIPKRDTKYDFTKPVDGSIAATNWKGTHTLDEILHIYNPPNGWLQNCNSSAFTAAGNYSPKKENFPVYMAPDGEDFRGINAVRVLSAQSKFSMNTLIDAGYDSYLSAFDILIPALVKVFNDSIEKNNPLYDELKIPIDTLKNWNKYASENSYATTLAITWGEKLLPVIFQHFTDDDAPDEPMVTKQFADTANAATLLLPLKEAITFIKENYGDWWTVNWGTINRYQRLHSYPNEKFDDDAPSLPVGFAGSALGSLPSFASKTYPGTKKRYGYNGNSFICVVEFGKKIKAKSLLTGGESGNENSPHFSDQALMYTQGKFKDVLFYKEDVLQHAEKKYHPGEE